MKQFTIQKSDINNPKIEFISDNYEYLFISIEEKPDKFVFKCNESNEHEIIKILEQLELKY